jgi:signal transduction histidine kinase
MRTTGGTVTITCETIEADAEACVRVTDEGPGIPPELLPRVFEPFFTTKPVNEGTGLGLAAAHGIAQRHGGRLEAASIPGKGSAFSLYLPLVCNAKALSRPTPQ